FLRNNRVEHFVRPGQMRRLPEHPAPFVERFVEESDFELFEVAHPAVQEFRGARTRFTGEIPSLEKQYRVTAERRLTGRGCAMDSAADNDEVKIRGFRSAKPGASCGVRCW